ncbi:Putative flavin monooxygenase, FAD/NAD(P)-binding domain superfamily [Septoria linicola]|uniref:Flavin monooxygenase, FAD/NAD(P)-binding domain superfamily n=1 Tax=Septoria linicola TaxID=215465 RepID=A0A9Q9B5M6_9PEZI|nr:Putative flavin monooxygenase, FAD/NAD(P)-binding domain superfamily [Septoria linicola]
MAPRVAVIGAGPLGLIALKTFLEDRFEAVLFERRESIGGLWKYSEDDFISVADNTEFNSSKFRSALSDFPMPDDMNDFPTAKQLYKYFHDYTTCKNLWPHIRLGHEVTRMTYISSDFICEEERGRSNSSIATSSASSKDADTVEDPASACGKVWQVSIVKGGVTMEDHFEKVAIATGPWTRPRKLECRGIEQFQGRLVHSINFHRPADYKGNVLVVGMSASAQDVVSALQGHAHTVYLSHRSPVAMIPRYTPTGSIFDRGPTLHQTVSLAYLFSWMPQSFQKKADQRIRCLTQTAYPNIPQSWGLDPTPSLAIAPPLVAAQLWPHLDSGFCQLVPGVARIDGRQVHLTTGETLQDISAIINCTGYDQDVPIEIDPPEAHPYYGEGFKPKYFQNVIPIHEDEGIRNSLALLGHGTIHHPGFVRFEIQAMAVSQIWKGNSHLPSFNSLRRWQKMRCAWRDDVVRTYGSKSTFYTLLLPYTDHILWLDDTAGCGIRKHFGLIERWMNFSAWKFWWQDRAFYKQCLHGVMSPALFRLFDTGKRKTWDQAKHQVQVDNEKVEQAAQLRRKMMDEGKVPAM